MAGGASGFLPPASKYSMMTSQSRSPIKPPGSRIKLQIPQRMEPMTMSGGQLHAYQVKSM